MMKRILELLKLRRKIVFIIGITIFIIGIAIGFFTANRFSEIMGKRVIIFTIPLGLILVLFSNYCEQYNDLTLLFYKSIISLLALPIVVGVLYFILDTKLVLIRSVIIVEIVDFYMKPNKNNSISDN